MSPALTDLFHQLNRHYQAKLPFAVYHKPNAEKVFGIFQKGAELHQITDFTEKGFVLVSFDGRQKIVIPASASEVKQANLEGFQVTEPTRWASSTTSAEAKNNFKALVKKGIEAIQNGAFGKAVLSRKESFEVSDFALQTAFQKLLNAYPTAFAYCFYHPKTGLWLGAFAEQFIRVKNRKLQTMAVAGTQLNTGIEPIVWPEKEVAEQLFVTDFITESLVNLADDTKTSEPYTMKAGNLLHIKTDIEAHLKESALSEVVKVLHPTPAVCGFPKDNAMQFIQKNEGYDREFYSGFLGELNLDLEQNESLTDLYVNLRCMKVEENKVNVYVGCGITKDSNPEKEWIETVNKSMTIKKIFE